MPYGAKKTCNYPGCNQLTIGTYCEKHAIQTQQERTEKKRLLDKDRPTRTQRGYDNRWLRASAAYRQAHPLCAICESEGRITPSEVVDHIVPHKGDIDLFWDPENWQALCKKCHDIKTGKGE